MNKIPVYTSDMRGLRGLSDKDKQRVIDERTDRLATFMAKRHYVLFCLVTTIETEGAATASAWSSS